MPRSPAGTSPSGAAGSLAAAAAPAAPGERGIWRAAQPSAKLVIIEQMADEFS